MDWLDKEKAEQEKQEALRRHLNDVLRGQKKPNDKLIIEKMRRDYGRITGLHM